MYGRPSPSIETYNVYTKLYLKYSSGYNSSHTARCLETRGNVEQDVNRERSNQRQSYTCNYCTKWGLPKQERQEYLAMCNARKGDKFQGSAKKDDAKDPAR